MPAPTCAAAGAAVGALVAALLTGVVTEGALVPLRIPPPLTLEAAAALVEEPAGQRFPITFANQAQSWLRVFGAAAAGASP